MATPEHMPPSLPPAAPDGGNSPSISSATVPLVQVLAWVGTAIVLTAGGTYTLVSSSISAQVEALKTKLEDARPAAGSPVLAGLTIDQATNDEKLAPLANRIQDLEKERAVLIRDLVQRTQNSLAPDSELANLLKQLDAADVRLRQQAVEGLFHLRDPKAVPGLVSYLRQRPEEATTPPNFHIIEWLRMLGEIDARAGADVAVHLLESSERYHAAAANNHLAEYVHDTHARAYLRTPLEALALRSGSALVRTRCKLLLAAFAKAETAEAAAKDRRPPPK